MLIYNVFPLLAGPFPKWDVHFDRAAGLGFDWIFVNPIHRPGRSGSLYSVADHFDFNPLFLDSAAGAAPAEQVRAMTAAARSRGMRVMIDLVINHCAADSVLVREHPEWLVWKDGALVHPGCDENGKRVVWTDLAQLDYRNSRDVAGLEGYMTRVTDFLVGLGFTGFRCDAAYQVPRDVWRRLIEHVRAAHPEVVFVAETLGCTPDRTRETAEAGFHAVFNSGKWWDFQSPWLMEQYDLVRETCGSIGFPESHDTPRLAEETHGNFAAMKQRYLFAALFSEGVLMPIGFEFGFRRRLHVVSTRPEQWEDTGWDMSKFIRRTNAIKRDNPVFQSDCPTHIVSNGNPSVLVMWKGSSRTRDEALVILNKDVHNYQHFHAESLRRLVQSGAPLKCVSPENALPFVPEPFTYELRPGEGIVLVAKR